MKKSFDEFEQIIKPELFTSISTAINRASYSYTEKLDPYDRDLLVIAIQESSIAATLEILRRYHQWSSATQTDALE